jgi:uncharacterized phage infection (PIP) family protein YhgE
MNKTPLAAIIAASALAVAGCGSSSKSSSGRGYADTGKAISDVCAKGDAQTKPLSAQLTGKAKHDVPILTTLVKDTKDSINQIKAIKPNSKLQAAFDKYTAALDAAAAESDKLLAAAKTGSDAAYIAEARKVQATTNSTHSDARALGATACETD